MYDVAVIGGGIAGMATAVRLQAKGLSTVVFESHGRIGGCAGYFRRKGFAFDVGATTLVDFEPGGVGSELMDSIGLTLDYDPLPGYQAWLPDRTVTLYRDPSRWHTERLQQLGNSSAHREFWRLLDTLATVFWQTSRRGITLPIRKPNALWKNMQSLGFRNLPYIRYLNCTLGDTLRHYNLRDDKPLCGLLGMLVEDTVHSSLEDAPLINAALGITIRGAGLIRHRGGMYGFWQRFVKHYRLLGGQVWTGCPVANVDGHMGLFILRTSRGTFQARQVVSAVSATIISKIAPSLMQKSLQRYLQRDAESLGGAIVIFLGVPEHEVAHQSFTHHQLLQDYNQPLGNGNNMFISVSSPNEPVSAPSGYRAVMISTHCELAPWKNLTPQEYEVQKQEIGRQLLHYARRVFPALGCDAQVYEIGTPSTYARFTRRPDGAVGSVRQTLANSNQKAIPYDIGPTGFWLVGDNTWPGLGTVACVLGSRNVAEAVIRQARQFRAIRSLSHEHAR